MKYSLECKVLSNISIGQTIRFALDEKEYVFLPDDNGILSKIKIIKTIDNANKFYSEIAKTSPIAITLNEDHVVREEMISDFQYLEAHIGFITQLTKIFWNEPVIEWIPETDDERNKLEVFSAHFRRENSFPPTELSIKFLREIIRNKPALDSLTILMSFYREGKVFFDRQEFIYAFYVFYFILEDLFGKESWRNREVEKNFKSSLELQETIKWVLTKVIGTNGRHKKEIMTLLGQKNLQYDVEGIIVLLVRMRGHLHHFSRKSELKQKPSPLIHQNYESPAVLTMAIAMQSILNEIDKAKKSKSK